jgi:hypothetical protein
LVQKVGGSKGDANVVMLTHLQALPVLGLAFNEFETSHSAGDLRTQSLPARRILLHRCCQLGLEWTLAIGIKRRTLINICGQNLAMPSCMSCTLSAQSHSHRRVARGSVPAVSVT